MKKYRTIITLLILSTLLLTACGSNKATDSATATDSAEEKEPVTISYCLWGGDEREEYTKKQIEAFEEEYPYITVELDYKDWETMTAEIDGMMDCGLESDVMQINYNWLNRYSSDGNGFYDLNELSDIIQLDAFSETSLSFGQVNGKQNAVVIAMNTSVPVYNKTMYDYYGLELPESIEELYADAEIMKADNVYQLGMKDNMLFIFLCGCYENEYGVSIVGEDGNFNLTDEGYAYLAETYKSLIDNYIVCPRSEYTETRIEGNRVAGVMCWLNAIETYKTIMTDAGNEPEVGKFIWTDTSERLGNYIKPSMMLAISAHTEHPEESALLLNYLVNDKTAAALQGVEKGVPDSRYAQQTLMESGSLNNDMFYRTLSMNYYNEYMNVMPEKLEDDDVIEEMLDALDAYAYGNKSLAETIATMKGI